MGGGESEGIDMIRDPESNKMTGILLNVVWSGPYGVE
jgi:hypothetical protein